MPSPFPGMDPYLEGSLWMPMQQPLPDAPYFVVLSRAEERPISEVWPIQLDERLPLVPVPLLPDDADVSLDLQQALTNVYDLLGYDLAIDYSGPPELPCARSSCLGGKAPSQCASLGEKVAQIDRSAAQIDAGQGIPPSAEAQIVNAEGSPPALFSGTGIVGLKRRCSRRLSYRSYFGYNDWLLELREERIGYLCQRSC